MTDRVRALESPIHGVGVFALRRFRKDAYIATFEGKETKEDGTHVLWIVDEDGRDVGIEGQNDLRYLNHSLAPNAEFRGANLHAIRNIQPGHEITFHYGDAWEDIE